MKKFGLIGYPLTHSFSQKYFEEKFERSHIADCSYELFPLSSLTELPSLVKSNIELVGLNVTIPYKETVIPYLDEIDPMARKVGAVNCIKISNGKLNGYNTDAFGFEQSLKKFLTSKPAQAFILGTGGSARAVRYTLRNADIDFFSVSRQPGKGEIPYGEISENMKDSNLFINTTPLGMHSELDYAAEIPYQRLTSNDFLFDLIYNPAETLFLKKGKANGAQIKNGMEMLQLQAEKSWEIWNGNPA